MHIPLRAPFRFTHTLNFLRAFSPMSGEQRIGRDTLVKSWIVRGKPVTVSMKQDGERLTCAFDARLDAATEAALRDRVAAFVSADEDLTELYALAARDERFAPVADKLHGFHHPKFATPFDPGADRAALERRGKEYGAWIGHWALYLWAATLSSTVAA